jgi:hypothetical protein
MRLRDAFRWLYAGDRFWEENSDLIFLKTTVENTICAIEPHLKRLELAARVLMERRIAGRQQLDDEESVKALWAYDMVVAAHQLSGPLMRNDEDEPRFCLGPNPLYRDRED